MISGELHDPTAGSRTKPRTALMSGACEMEFAGANDR